MVQLISDSLSWLNLLHSLLSCKYTYTFISCPAGIPVCLRTTEHQGSTALAALSSRRSNNHATGVALPILDTTQDPRQQLYLFAHLRHPESTIATAPSTLTHCDKSQSLSGPKLSLRARSQDARFPGGVLGLVRRCTVRGLQQVVRIGVPITGALHESKKLT
jgi:hypothetical protein